METRLPAECESAEELVRAVRAERVHERAGADVAVRACEGTAVQVAGAAGQGKRAIDDAHGGLADEHLRGLRLSEETDDFVRGIVRRRMCREVVVDQRGGARENCPTRRKIHDVLRRLHLRAGVGRGLVAPPACA